jgi:Ca2+-binding EF-hand superfamily protein
MKLPGMTDITSTGRLALLQEFERMDADNDGSVDLADFLRTPRQILADLGEPEGSEKGRAFVAANETQWNVLLALGDADADGVLSADEYVALRTSAGFRSPDRPGKGEVCRTLFDLLDRDGDETIDVDEFLRAAAFFCMPEADARSYFGRLDADGDSTLDRTEFTSAVKLFYGG